MNPVSSAGRALRRVLAIAGKPTSEASPAPAPASNPHHRRDIDLDQMRLSAGTDLEKLYYGHTGKLIFKWRHYLPLYDRALSRFVGRKIKVLEIGVAGGGSLQLWRRYLGEDAQIIGVDIMPESIAHAGPGIEIVIGSQGDESFLKELAIKHGPFDIIIDDGSHISSHQILSFETLFPHLKEDGVYVCEDLHTSYWSGWGGGLDREDTFTAYLKKIIDRVHVRYYAGEQASDSLADQIGSMLFADSIVFFFKQNRQDTFTVHVPAQAAS